MKTRMMVIVLLMIAGALQVLRAQDEIKTSAITGRVEDAETGFPLQGASVAVAGTELGAVTDSRGSFRIGGIPIGTYSLQFSYTGYESLVRTDIIVRSGRSTVLTAGMKMTAFEVEGITVESGYFARAEEEPVSTINFSQEEIRRAPGAAGDVSRIVTVLPSIAKVNDNVNGLIVRGGNPVENAFYIDNMQIPNINHYPQQGSSSGPIGLLNTDFLQDVNFSAGGFGAAYGNKLSSVMELRFREGSREKFQSTLSMNMVGFGLSGEGPLAGGKGSWMFSARKSFLDLLVDAIGTGVAPQYSDYQGKMVLDLSSKNQLSFVGVAGIDHISFDKETSLDEGDPYFGEADNVEHMFGVNWRYTGGRDWQMETSVSSMYTSYDDTFWQTRDDSLIYDDNSSEQSISLRNVSYYRFNSANRIKFGLEASHVINDYTSYTKAYHDNYGNLLDPFNVERKISADMVGGFMSWIFNPTGRFEINPGVRVDYFSLAGRTHVSPRFSFNYWFTDKTSLSGSAGVYYQHLPLAMLAVNKDFEDLRDPVAYHYILGINRMISENTRLTFEVYDKEYHNFPLDPSQPALFVADEGGNPDFLTDNGRASARGVELVIQKKVASDFYGLISGSVYQSRYRGYDGQWRDRVFGNSWMASMEGGYIASKKWEYSLRWIAAGGRPYTPFDITASKQHNTGIYDLSRINGERVPAYHSLNFRIDRRFNFRDSNLILFLDIWNLYNRKNLAAYYWNDLENEQDRHDQWSILPVFGLEWEF